MKQLILALACACLVLFARPASAQYQQSTTNGMPPSVAGLSTSNCVWGPFQLRSSMTLGGAENLGVYTTMSGTAGPATNYILTWAPSIDNVTPINTNLFTTTNGYNGTNIQRAYSYVGGSNYYGASSVFVVGVQNLGTNTLYPSNIVTSQY